MSKLRTRNVGSIKTLDGLVTDFRERLGPEGPLEHGYLQWMRDSASLTVAIKRAVDSRMPNGKMHNHQSRVPQHVKDEYTGRLRAVTRRIRACRTFAALLGLCEEHKPAGIGPVTAYDVATRIGEYLGLHPEVTYLHAGVKEGAKALGLNINGKTALTREDLPVALRTLTANEVEDFLCVYREHLPRMARAVRGELYD